MNRRKNPYLHQDRIAMRIADRYGMIKEYKTARRNGLSPIEALEDWDLLLLDERHLFDEPLYSEPVNSEHGEPHCV